MLGFLGLASAANTSMIPNTISEKLFLKKSGLKQRGFEEI